VTGRSLQGKSIGRSMLIWTGAGPGQGSIIGPANSFRFVGASIRDGRGGQEVASFCDGVWFCRPTKRSCSVMWVEHDSTIHFEDPKTGQGTVLGPFDMIGLVDDTIYVNREHSRGVAQLNHETGHWNLLDTGVSWPEIVLKPAPTPPFRLEHIWPTEFAEHG